MPWMDSSVDDAKLRFVLDYLKDGNMSAVCARHGISRTTGHKYLARYEAEGAAGLAERSRAPLMHGRATASAVCEALVELRRAKPYWGPRKLLAVLSERAPETAWPSASTVAEILRRAGLSTRRRRVRRPEPQEQPFGTVLGPNDTWSVDFKGYFHTGDGQRCDPLTVSDAFSRYCLGLEIVAPRGAEVEPVMERLLREYGLPLAIRSDNGPPFAGTGAGGLSRLSAGWAKLGIRLERIIPGQPQQNGRHERLHGTLKAESCVPPAADTAAQRARFERFRTEYNEERPHEALGQVPPARLYRPSPRRYPDRVEEPAYGADEIIRRVRSNGEIKWRGGTLFLSDVLVGEPVGIRQIEDGKWLVRFAQVKLAIIDETTDKLTRLGAGRPPRAKSSQQPEPETVNDVSGQNCQ